MSPRSLDLRLAELEAVRYQFSRGDGTRVEKVLRTLDHFRFPDPASLIRFHEALMFVRAFPQMPRAPAAERILNGFHKKVETLRKSGADMDAFDTFEVFRHRRHGDGRHAQLRCCALAGRAVCPGQVEIAWDNYEPAAS